MKFINIALFLGVMFMYGLHYFTILQLNGYTIKLSQRTEQFFLINSLIIILFSLTVVIILPFFSPRSLTILSIISLAVLMLLLIFAYINKRSKLVFTPRVKRLILVYGIIIVLLCGIVFIRQTYLFYSAMCIFLLLSPLVCVISHRLILPFENKNNNNYIKKTKETLAQNNLLIKIGITGSYGKTSCKNILYNFLSTSNNTIATKASFNTPLGIAKSIKDINKATDIFIAEMGARKIGDIKELVDIVKPKFAIITGVTRQHLETFETIENIYKEKQELANGIPNDGFCVFNGENCYTKHMYYKFKGKKSIVGFSKSFDIYAENIVTSANGSEFDIISFDKTIRCSTKLLGKHNILNILLCFAMAKRFNIKDIAIKETIALLHPTKHRLELIKTDNGITVIDDSYNCNIEGAIAAFEVLKDFEGRKIIFSQGIVEMGDDRQGEINKYLGRLIAKVADIVILCSSNSNSIKNGLIEAEFSGEILEYKSLNHAQKNFKDVLKIGDVLLLQNDLPDNF